MWRMQPFWALSFPSLDALEECEQRRARIAQNSAVPSNPPNKRKSRVKQEKPATEPVVVVYSELIAEHFARAVYIA